VHVLRTPPRALGAWLLAAGVGLAGLLMPAPARAQNPTPYWTFEVGSWIGSGYRTPEGGFSHCAILGRYRSGMSMAVVMDAHYDLQVAVGNPDWQLEIGALYEVGLSVDGRDLGRFAAAPANRSVFFVQVGPREDVLERLRRGRVLEISTPRERLAFALTDTYVALGKLKQCVDSARLWTSPQANPFATRPGAGAPSPGIDAGDAEEFRLTIAGILEAAGLPAVVFVDPVSSEHEGATLVWRADGIDGALFFLMMDAAQAGEFSRELIGSIAKNCRGTFASQTGPSGRVGDSQLSEFSLACEAEGQTEFVAATVLAGDSGTLVFVHFAVGDGARLRELNADLMRVLAVVSSH